MEKFRVFVAWLSLQGIARCFSSYRLLERDLVEARAQVQVERELRKDERSNYEERERKLLDRLFQRNGSKAIYEQPSAPTPAVVKQADDAKIYKSPRQKAIADLRAAHEAQKRKKLAAFANLPASDAISAAVDVAANKNNIDPLDQQDRDVTIADYEPHELNIS